MVKMELDPSPRFDKVYYQGLKNMNEGESDVCKCGHNIHEHEAVMDCKCYVYGDRYEYKLQRTKFSLAMPIRKRIWRLLVLIIKGWCYWD